MTQLNVETRFAAYEVRAWFTLVWVVGAIGLEWYSKPEMRFLSFLQLRWSTLRAHPAPALAIAYGLWSLFAAFFTPEVSISLTGTLDEGVEGAFWTLLLGVAFLLVYLRSLEDANFVRRLSWGLVVGALVVGGIGLLEVVLRRGLLYNVAINDLPMSSFPQRGHLAGYLIFAAGAGIGLWLRDGNRLTLVATTFLALTIGLTQNRAVVTALGLLGTGLLWLNWRKSWKPVVLVLSLSVIGFVSGFLIKQATQITDSREFQNTISTEIRLLYWKAGTLSIFDHPVFGWGPSGYYKTWPNYLNDQELTKVMKLEYGLIYRSHFQSSFLCKNIQGQTTVFTVTGWRSHNQLVEVGLMRGLPGLFLYVFLLFLLLKNWKSPLSLAVLTYHVFLFTWYVPIETTGILWIVWGASFVVNKHKTIGANTRTYGN